MCEIRDVLVRHRERSSLNSCFPLFGYYVCISTHRRTVLTSDIQHAVGGAGGAWKWIKGHWKLKFLIAIARAGNLLSSWWNNHDFTSVTRITKEFVGNHKFFVCPLREVNNRLLTHNDEPLNRWREHLTMVFSQKTSVEWNVTVTYEYGQFAGFFLG